MTDRITYEQIASAALQVSLTIGDLVEEWQQEGGSIPGDTMADLMSHKRFLDSWLNRRHPEDAADIVAEASEDWLSALNRLIPIAMKDTHQSRHVANFLLAWFHSRRNGAWDPTDLWGLDLAIRADILRCIAGIAASHGGEYASHCKDAFVEIERRHRINHEA